MGYMGLEGIVDSDYAADLAYCVMKAAAKEMRRGLKEKPRGYNTAGCVNVALIFEHCFCRSTDTCIKTDESLLKVAKETRDKLLKEIDYINNNSEWEDNENKAYHLKAYQRLVKNLTSFIKKGEK